MAIVNSEKGQAARQVDEVFHGNLTIAEAIQRLRLRLLDLSPRNRLLNYRFPRSKCVQFADKPDLDLLLERLTEGKSINIAYVKEPLPLEYPGGKRPDSRSYAQRLGVDVSYEFPQPQQSPRAATRRMRPFQSLLYPVELERLLRRIANEARTVVEETGTNMLYLMFGFFRFYEDDNSDRSFLAPILSLPVVLSRTEIDENSRTYQYSLEYSGEDLAENRTLREKLRRDHSIELPNFEEEDTPEVFFKRVELAVATRPRWKVMRQLTLGFLSFGKLAIWADLDPKRWPGLFKNPILEQIFKGSPDGAGNATFDASDYPIDRHKWGELPLIYDADASQHSAIIDAIEGKNLVINGPPGTGKSQTITNIIATALAQGKKVLFVSEKLAALEVVRDRLEKARLGCFCLELHSHKTQKKKLLQDLSARLDQQFATSDVRQQLVLLNRQKAILNRQAELMENRLGNQLGKNVHEILWAAERWRQELGHLVSLLSGLVFPDAPSWTYDQFEDRRAQIGALGRSYVEADTFDTKRAWTGFQPRVLSPGEDIEIATIISQASQSAEAMVAHAEAFTQKVREAELATVRDLEQILDLLKALPQPGEWLQGELLTRFFPSSDPAGIASGAAIAALSDLLGRGRHLLAKAAHLIDPKLKITGSELDGLTQTAATLVPMVLNFRLSEFQSKARNIAEAIPKFEHGLIATGASFRDFTAHYLETFESNLAQLGSLDIAQTSIQEIQRSLDQTTFHCENLTAALERVSEIARTHLLPFDGTMQSLTEIAKGRNFIGLLPGISVDSSLVSDANARARRQFAHLPISDLRPKALALRQLASSSETALEDIRRTARGIGMPLEETVPEVAVFGTIVRIAQAAPQALLKYRNLSYESPHIIDLITRIASAKSLEERMRVDLEKHFHLDALPQLESLKASLRAFRRPSLLAVLSADKRAAAKRAYKSICKTPRRWKSENPKDLLAALIAWLEHLLQINDDVEYRSAFGALFEGANTDLERVRRLADWYSASRGWLLEHAGQVSRISLTQLSADQIALLSANAQTLLQGVEQLCTLKEQARKILGVAAVLHAPNDNLTNLVKYLSLLSDQLLDQFQFFNRLAKPNLSCDRALELLEAKVEFAQAEPELQRLLTGLQNLSLAGGRFFESAEANQFENWFLHLDKIHSRCKQVRALLDILGTHFSTNATPQQIDNFLVAKLNLDRSVGELGSTSWIIGIEDWPSYRRKASEISTSSDRLITALAGEQTADEPLAELFDAARTRIEGEQLIAQALADPNAKGLFGAKLLSPEINLVALIKTHAWGTQIAALRGCIPHSLLDGLLGPDASRMLDFASKQLSGIRGALRGVRRSLREIEAYEKIDWSRWQSPVRSREGEDLVSEIHERLETARQSIAALLPWSRLLLNMEDCRERGTASLVTALENDLIAPSSLDVAYNYITYNSIAKSIYKDYPELARFDAGSHDILHRQYIELDKRLIEANGLRFAHTIHTNTRIPPGTTGPRASDFSEKALLRRELNKQRRHLPIRQLIKRAGVALQALKPCFMMGPLSVAQYLEPGSVYFDLVVMDEASQLRPEDALGAIARGSQLIVVGDSKQLPPTSFFDRLVEDDDEESDDTPAITEGMESILDICQQLNYPVRALRWYYRSAHESLISFSNHYFYDDRLIVFPSRYQRSANLGIKYRYINNGFYQNRANLNEARIVVDSIVEHMLTHPDESLGVVTVNQTQRDLIFEMFERKLAGIEACRAFLEKYEREGWPFFVKSLENVQGDERDVIFISTNFGKAPGTDVVRPNFGPIGRRDGWRRLNVLFTRARLRLHLFTSMRSSDIVTDEKTPLGTSTLRDYLAYAERGLIVETDAADREPDSDFEIAVARVLRSNGFEVKPQLGVAGYFIDIAVRNPHRRGEFIAAIECDGAAYHSSRSARDRDRIRQEILERLGWKDRIYRIWSTDWYANPARASAKLLTFVQSCCAASEPITQDVGADATAGGEGIKFAENYGTDRPAFASEELDYSAQSDFFIEVGDTVTYGPAESPAVKTTIIITAGPSHPSRGLVNEHAPLAQAILGLYAGEIADLILPGQATRSVKILKVRRDSVAHAPSST